MNRGTFARGTSQGSTHRALPYAFRAMLLLAGSATALAPLAAQAQESTTRKAFDIPAGPLADAIALFGQQAGIQVTASDALVSARRNAPLRGSFGIAEGLSTMLAGTGLTYRFIGANAVRIEAAPQGGDHAIQLGTVQVEATALGAEGSAPLPPAYAGGKVARGGRAGLLGNRDTMDTPLSMVSYTEQTIRDQQASSVAELLFVNDPSVRASIGSSNRYDALTIRGLRVPNSDIALNGVYGLLPNWRVGPDAVERVELLKGPGALLNGMAPGGSIGGGVNVVSKQAGETPLNRVTAEYESDAHFGGHVDMGRRFGADHAFGIRINGAIRGGKTPYDGQTGRSSAGSVNLDYRANTLRLSLDLIYQADWMRAPERGPTVAAGTVMPAVPDPRINMSQSFDFGDSQSLTGLGRAEYDIASTVTLYATAGANGFNFTKREANGPTILNAKGDATADTNIQTGHYRTNTQEVGLRAQLATGPIDHKLSVSASRLYQAYQLGQITYATYTTNIYNPVRLLETLAPLSAYGMRPASDLALRSVALADTLSVAQDLVQLTAGVRLQGVSTNSYSSATGAVTRHYESDATTPMVGLVVRPSKAVSLYGNYIQALTPGPAVPTGAINSGDVFAPYKSKQLEVGAKLDLGTFGATLAAFQIKVPNGITDPVTKIYALNGEQRNRGIELHGFGTITPGLRLLGGVTFQEGKLTRTPGGINDGHNALGVPNVQVNMAAEWDPAFVHGLTVGGRVIHTGTSWLDAANAYRVPAWTRFDLTSRYAVKAAGVPLTLQANLTNAFNHRYWESNPSGYLIVGAPRTVWLSVSADF